MKATSKRRRGKEQIRQEKAAEEEKKQSDGAKIAQYDAMRSRTEAMQQELNVAQEFRDQLLEHGIFKPNAEGGLDFVADQKERSDLQEEKIKASKQKSSLIGGPGGEMDDLESHRSFQSAHGDVDLEDMS